MFTTLIILCIVAAVILVLLVLIQNPKGGGLSQFTGASSQQLFGVQQTGDILEKGTWGFAAAIAVFSLVSIFFVNTSGGGEAMDDGLGTAAPVSVPMPKPATTPAPAAPIAPAKK